jgi:hypothetical protein
LFWRGNVASFRMQVSRTTLKIRFSATQCASAPLRFHERDRFLLGYGFVAVFAVGAGERRREPEPDDLPLHYGCRIHEAKLSKRTNQTRCTDVFGQAAFRMLVGQRRIVCKS